MKTTPRSSGQGEAANFESIFDEKCQITQLAILKSVIYEV